MKKKTKIIIIVLAVVLAVAIGLGAYFIIKAKKNNVQNDVPDNGANNFNQVEMPNDDIIIEYYGEDNVIEDNWDDSPWIG